MANTCLTEYSLEGDKDSVNRAYDLIKGLGDLVTGKNSISITSLFYALPITSSEVVFSELPTRGSLYAWYRKSVEICGAMHHSMTLLEESAWNPCCNVVSQFAHLMGLSCSWYAEEPGCVMFVKHIERGCTAFDDNNYVVTWPDGSSVCPSRDSAENVVMSIVEDGEYSEDDTDIIEVEIV